MHPNCPWADSRLYKHCSSFSLSRTVLQVILQPKTFEKTEEGYIFYYKSVSSVQSSGRRDHNCAYFIWTAQNIIIFKHLKHYAKLYVDPFFVKNSITFWSSFSWHNVFCQETRSWSSSSSRNNYEKISSSGEEYEACKPRQGRGKKEGMLTCSSYSNANGKM